MFGPNLYSFMSTKLIKFVAVTALMLVLFLCAINHLTYRIGYGIPGGEIDFLGLTKQEVAKKLKENKIDGFIFADGYNGKSYKNIEELMSDPLIMKSNSWGVNCKQAGNVTYIQLLLFDSVGTVYKQKISYSFDGP